ncbi:hypothetical protein ACJJTC_013409 [Scirpophaga incertulas]
MALTGVFVTQKVCENITCATDFSQKDCDFKDIYYTELKKLYSSEAETIKKLWTNDKVLEVIRHLKNARVSIECGSRRTPAEYHWSKKYEEGRHFVLFFGGEPKSDLRSSTIPQGILKYITTKEQLARSEKSNADSLTLQNSIVMRDSNKVSTLENDFRCIVCKDLTSGAHQCCSCLRHVHTICGETIGNEGYGASVLCLICKRKQGIQSEGSKSHQGLKRAAEKMITDTVKKLPVLNIGDSVFLNVPKIDRGPIDAKNISGKILDMRHGVYQIGTSNGTIKNWFNRKELKISSNKYLEEIPESLFGGQGFSKCLCKPSKRQCQNNRCVCFKNNVLCGSCLIKKKRFFKKI